MNSLKSNRWTTCIEPWLRTVSFHTSQWVCLILLNCLKPYFWTYLEFQLKIKNVLQMFGPNTYAFNETYGW